MRWTSSSLPNSVRRALRWAMGSPPGSRLRQPKPTEGTLNCQQPSWELHLACQSWPCTAACTAPWPRRSPGGCSPPMSPPTPRPAPVPRDRGGGAGARAGRAAVGRRRSHSLTVAWPVDHARGRDRGPQRRVVRSGMGRPGSGRRYGPVSSGAHHHRPGRPSPTTPTPARAAGARSWRSGRSSRLPAARCSPCPRSLCRRSASTAVSRPAGGSPAGSPRRSPLPSSRTRPASPAGPARPGVPHRAGHTGQPQPRQPCLRPPGRQRRPDRPSPHAAPCPGVGDGGPQGAGQHHRRPAAPCRRRRPRPTGLHPSAPPDRTPGGRGDRGRVPPSGAGRVRWCRRGVRWRETGAKPERRTRPDRTVGGGVFAAQSPSVAGTGFEPV